jgi:hypothetical protein
MSTLVALLTPPLLGLASGFLGAILGAYVAVRINRGNRKVAATERMLSLVYPIGFKSWLGARPREAGPNLPRTLFRALGGSFFTKSRTATVETKESRCRLATIYGC